LTQYTKEGVESLHFHIVLGQITKCVCSQQSLADFQCGQMVKSHSDMQSAVKVTVKN